MDTETKEEPDITDYVSTITPGLLNLSNKCEYDFKPEVQRCSFMYYVLVFILFFLLFQIVLKLKIVHHEISSLFSVLSSLSFKMDHIIKLVKPIEPSSPKTDCVPNLNYILDFIQHLDKKHKCD